MKKLLILSILIIFGCDNSTNPDCADGGISCGFNANIILMNNSIPLTGADVFIMYNNNPSFNNPGLQRPNTTIIYDIPSEGNVKINEYDLDDNLIRNIVDGLMSPGRYNTSIVSMNYFAPFGLCVTKIALEFNDELLTQYPVFMTIPDFSQTINLGQTDGSGQLILNSDFLTSYNIPTFYNTPNIMRVDSEGNPLVEFSINDLTDGLTIYFLNEGVYKSFNINLQNGSYNYSFDWTQGEIEDYSMRRDNIVEDEVEDTFLVPNSSVSSDNISPPELNLFLYPNPFN